jgi:hypothetical protein
MELLSYGNTYPYQKNLQHPNQILERHLITKYCKTVLSLKKTACNISTLSELGRLPIASFIKTQVMMYFEDYFWLLEAWLYIRGGIRPYTIFHNYNLKWDGSACQRVYTRG